MANLNHSPSAEQHHLDLVRAIVCLSRAIPKCLDDSEVIDAIAYSIAVLRYLLSTDGVTDADIDKFEVELMRINPTNEQKM